MCLCRFRYESLMFILNNLIITHIHRYLTSNNKGTYNIAINGLNQDYM